jgi:hypothetical protein
MSEKILVQLDRFEDGDKVVLTRFDGRPEIGVDECLIPIGAKEGDTFMYDEEARTLERYASA